MTTRQFGGDPDLTWWVTVTLALTLLAGVLVWWTSYDCEQACLDQYGDDHESRYVLLDGWGMCDCIAPDGTIKAPR